MAHVPSLVTTDWLKSRLEDPDTRILDASWHMPNAKRNPEEDFSRERIPGARFFDLDAIADTSSKYPHMLPSATAFVAAADSLSITNSTHVVIYDTSGLFSSPRVWWIFQSFGHKRVSVLDGGFPAWSAEGLPVIRSTPADVDEISAPGKAAQHPPASPSYGAHLLEEWVRNTEQMKANISSQDAVVVDARCPGRFQGTAPEPREGIPSGHIPGSRSVPFAEVLTTDGRFLKPEEIQKVFDDAGVDTKQPIITTCGTGVTASVLALATQQLSEPPPLVSVYDGSWTEWGADSSLPRAEGPP